LLCRETSQWMSHPSNRRESWEVAISAPPLEAERDKGVGLFLLMMLS
jgi:hypothetical protein